MNIAVLASTSGTDLPALFRAGEDVGVQFTLLTNVKDALARQKAKDANIESIFIDPTGCTREKYDTKMLEILRKKKIEFIFCIGYMRIISPVITAAFKNKMLNIHPSLLPAFAGGMDTDVHKEVLKSGAKKTGATLHYVTDEVDGGAIFSQQSCTIDANKTPESLKTKVQQLEMKMLEEAIQKIANKK